MMRDYRLSELGTALMAQRLGQDVLVRGVGTDTRGSLAGKLFVALEGERFDGHAYLDVAAEAGALAALVKRETRADLPQLVVSDTQRGLGHLGAYNRSLFNGPLVAITGSNGKTTAKTMISSVLSQRGATLATEGNLNNEIGVPLTLLRLAPEHEFAVVEMGAAKAGDIAWLCELARPTVAVLLNAMPAHLEGFGSVAGVAEAKGEIYDALGSDGTAVVNADQEYAKRWASRARHARVVDYGLNAAAAISASHIRHRGLSGVSFVASTPAGEVPVTLKLPGLHNVSNALAAIAVGLTCEVPLGDIAAGLAQARAVAGRLAACTGAAGATVIDDCYNANPGSVRAAIRLLADCEGRRTLVLGAMRELGGESERLHREIGQFAREAGLDSLWGVGPDLLPAVEAFGDGARHFVDRVEAAAATAGEFAAVDTVLVKGSRGAAMETVLAALLGDQVEARD